MWVGKLVRFSLRKINFRLYLFFLSKNTRFRLKVFPRLRKIYLTTFYVILINKLTTSNMLHACIYVSIINFKQRKISPKQTQIYIQEHEDLAKYSFPYLMLVQFGLEIIYCSSTKNDKNVFKTRKFQKMAFLQINFTTQ